MYNKEKYLVVFEVALFSVALALLTPALTVTYTSWPQDGDFHTIPITGVY